MYSVCLWVSKLFLSECVDAGFSSDRKHEKFAVGARVLVNTQNVVILRCSFVLYLKNHAEGFIRPRIRTVQLFCGSILFRTQKGVSLLKEEIKIEMFAGFSPSIHTSIYLKVQLKSSDSLSTRSTSAPGTLQMGLFTQSLPRL